MAAESNARQSNSTVLLLLAINLIATIALLAHVVYYIPEGKTSSDLDATANQPVANLAVDGVGDVGMGGQGIELKLIQLNENNPTGEPDVVQTITMSQQAFLNTLQRMTILRDRLVEKDLIRAVDREDAAE